MNFNLTHILSIKQRNILTIRKQTLATRLYIFGLFIAFVSSLHPWFLWSITNVYMVIASVFIMGAMFISANSKEHIFTNKGFLLPAIISACMLFDERLSMETSASGFIAAGFNSFIFFTLFKVNPSVISRFSNLTSRVMGTFLIFSLAAYFLNFVGISVDLGELVYGDFQYLLTNHGLFLTNDYNYLSNFFPRFQSVCLEPSHLGTMLVLLLQTQRGKWKAWYNVVMLVSVAFSFSLGAYGYLVAVVFLNLWTNRKKIFMKVVAVIIVIASVVVGSFFYNNGDNLVYQLILLRLEVDDGELSGNNRTTEDFDKEFESFLSSDNIWLGRELKDDQGNSGYKVYLYRNGILGVTIFMLFLFLTLSRGKDRRAMLSSIIVALLVFIVDGFVSWYCRYISLYDSSLREGRPKSLPNYKEE